MTPEASFAILSAAQKIAAWEAELLSRMKRALQSGNDAEALKLARELVGLEYEKGHRANPSEHRGAGGH